MADDAKALVHHVGIATVGFESRQQLRKRALGRPLHRMCPNSPAYRKKKKKLEDVYPITSAFQSYPSEMLTDFSWNKLYSTSERTSFTILFVFPLHSF